MATLSELNTWFLNGSTSCALVASKANAAIAAITDIPLTEAALDTAISTINDLKNSIDPNQYHGLPIEAPTALAADLNTLYNLLVQIRGLV